MAFHIPTKIYDPKQTMPFFLTVGSGPDRPSKRRKVTLCKKAYSYVER